MTKRLKYFALLTFPTIILASLVLLATLNKNKSSFIASKVTDFSGMPESGNLEGLYHGEKHVTPPVSKETNQPVLGVASPSERWIEIDLSEQKIRAWDGGNLFLESLVSTGLPWWPTPTGEFRIWLKLRATRMEGGEGKYYYNLPNVPFVMFFESNTVPGWRGFSLHGTYWHNDFGRVHSHGCVNLPTPIAEKLYYWVTPTLPQGKNIVHADSTNPGTKIVIHE